MQHAWVKSELGHGDEVCRTCFGTKDELSAIGALGECEGADLKRTIDQMVEAQQPKQLPLTDVLAKIDWRIQMQSAVANDTRLTESERFVAKKIVRTLEQVREEIVSLFEHIN